MGTLPFDSLLSQYAKIGIAGAPRTGKTTLSKKATNRPVVGTDAYMDMDWADIPHRMIEDVADKQTFLIEGVQVARALRKGMPVDAVVYLDQPMVEQSRGQARMGKAIKTIIRDWISKTDGELPPVFIRDGDGFQEVPARAYFAEQ